MLKIRKLKSRNTLRALSLTWLLSIAAIANSQPNACYDNLYSDLYFSPKAQEKFGYHITTNPNEYLKVNFGNGRVIGLYMNLNRALPAAEVVEVDQSDCSSTKPEIKPVCQIHYHNATGTLQWRWDSHPNNSLIGQVLHDKELSNGVGELDLFSTSEFQLMALGGVMGAASFRLACNDFSWTPEGQRETPNNLTVLEWAGQGSVRNYELDQNTEMYDTAGKRLQFTKRVEGELDLVSFGSTDRLRQLSSRGHPNWYATTYLGSLTPVMVLQVVRRDRSVCQVKFSRLPGAIPLGRPRGDHLRESSLDKPVTLGLLARVVGVYAAYPLNVPGRTSFRSRQQAVLQNEQGYIENLIITQAGPLFSNSPLQNQKQNQFSNIQRRVCIYPERIQ